MAELSCAFFSNAVAVSSAVVYQDKNPMTRVMQTQPKLRLRTVDQSPHEERCLVVDEDAGKSAAHRAIRSSFKVLDFLGEHLGHNPDPEPYPADISLYPAMALDLQCHAE